MADPQYTDAQLSDGRTLRFMGQLGPDEVKQKVAAFRTREGAQQISANPPGVPRPQAPSMPYETLLGGPEDTPPDATQSLKDMIKSGAKTAYQVSTPGIASSLAQRSSPATTNQLPPYLQPTPLKRLPDQIMDTGAPVMAGGMTEPEAIPRTWSDTPALPEAEAASTSTGRLGRLAGVGVKRIPGVKLATELRDAWNGPEPEVLPPPRAPQIGAGDAMATPRPRLIQKMGGQPVESITGKPSGRLILSPEEAQAETQQMSLAKKMASQRGMQYAAGMRPEDVQ